MLLTLYLRREPTRDPILAKAAGQIPACARLDVVAYRDAACTVAAARWNWFFRSRPDRRYKHVTMNCYRWRTKWLPDMGALA